MLQVRNLHKSYDQHPLLRGISFRVHPNETICLLGPSGSGKSTLLRLIAGLETPEVGQILWLGKDLRSTAPHLRDFGLVFQDYALFPHLNVFENVAFGLRMKDRPPEETEHRVGEVLALVNLSGFERRDVTDLSGGEQQRVALARALAPRPRLLMFDEPLGALDRALREVLLDQMRMILHGTGIPAIYVTHDQDEALKIADRLLLLHDGRIVRAGTPADVWARPGSAWVAEFLGLGNVLHARVLDRTPRVETRYGIYSLRCGHAHRVGKRLALLVRPFPANHGAVIRGIVEDVLFRDDGFRVLLRDGFFFDLPRRPAIGSRISVKVKLECLGSYADGRSGAAAAQTQHASQGNV